MSRLRNARDMDTAPVQPAADVGLAEFVGVSIKAHCHDVDGRLQAVHEPVAVRARTPMSGIMEQLCARLDDGHTGSHYVKLLRADAEALAGRDVLSVLFAGASQETEDGDCAKPQPGGRFRGLVAALPGNAVACDVRIALAQLFVQEEAVLDADGLVVAYHMPTPYTVHCTFDDA